MLALHHDFLEQQTVASLIVVRGFTKENVLFPKHPSRFVNQLNCLQC